MAIMVCSGACGSSPEPIYFAITPASPTHHLARDGGTGWARLVKLRRPAIAGYLDRTEVVSRLADHRLRVTSGESWSEPLGEMTGRVLAEDLAERVPGSVVFMESSPISADPDAVVSIDIQRFDAGDDGTLTLRVEVAVERARDRSPLMVRTLDLRAPTGPSTGALVATMSDLVGRLADQVAPYLEGS
jgi:uncharacterized lipoprotein YmbA